MSDPHGPRDADVRALLAGLGDEPLPAEVAARLDETLSALVEERRRAEDRETDRVVVPVDAAREAQATRRGRWAPRVLAAATVATVVGALGVGLTQLSGNTGSTMSQAGGGTADRSASSLTPAQLAALPRVESRHFRRDVRRVLASNGTASGLSASGASPQTSGNAQPREQQPNPGASPRTSQQQAPTLSSGVLTGCAAVPAVPPGARVVPVRLDGRPASLVVLGRPDGTARVTAWSCLGGRVLARTTVPR